MPVAAGQRPLLYLPFDRDVQPVGEHDRAIVFRTSLRAGSARLQTWLTDENGTKRGAYYVYVTRVC